MNRDELERQLRTQAGPREHGYRPGELPADLEGSSTRRRSRPLSLLGVASAVAAGALVVAVAAALLGSAGPQPAGSGTPSASPTATAVAPTASPSSGALAACAPEDVTVTAEDWGGAAGSRGSVLALSLAAGHDACLVSHPTRAWLTDANGTLLVSAEMPADAVALPLDDAHAYSVAVSWGNWCGADISGSVTIHLRLLGWSSQELDATPGAAEMAVPPCMGSGSPTTLSFTGLQPSS